MAAEEADIIRYVITGEDGEVIPRNATHVSVHPSVTIIPLQLFWGHSNIVELICHDGVIKIEYEAFFRCPRLKRVIMNGVEVVEARAFGSCEALEHVECEKLEIIGVEAFNKCFSLRSLNLPSAKTLKYRAFWQCTALVDAKFGNKWESIGGGVFYECRSLERITIPLKNGLNIDNYAFHFCENLRHADLVDKEALQQTIDALLWEEWKNNMNAEVASIDQILPNARAGNYINDGDKAIVLRRWIRKVLTKIIDYKSQHRCLLKEAARMLQLVLPHDIVMNNVAPFLTLPHHTFDGEDADTDKSDDDNVSIDEKYSSNVGSDEEEDNHGVSQSGATDTGEGGKQEGANDEEGRKRQKTGNEDGDNR